MLCKARGESCTVACNLVEAYSRFGPLSTPAYASEYEVAGMLHEGPSNLQPAKRTAALVLREEPRFEFAGIWLTGIPFSLNGVKLLMSLMFDTVVNHALTY